MDLQYLLLLQRFREAMGGALNGFFLQLSDLSYGVFIWMPACILCSFPSGHSVTALSNYGTVLARYGKSTGAWARSWPLCCF